MKTILACLLVLAISVTLSNAQCFFQPLESSMPGSEIAGCRDADGELREFGSSWMSNCNNCTCSVSGISCCSSYTRPVGYNEEECVSIFNKETCTYEVVEKADYSKACQVQGWVG